MKLAQVTAFAILAMQMQPLTARQAPSAETSQGTFRGQSLDDGLVVFRGIRYAEPPVGDARWQPPTPVADREGVQDATQFGAACMQPAIPASSIYGDDPPSMSEDCLTLNIWAAMDSRQAPVMVWLHGGSLLTGSGSSAFFDGARLASEGVIVVTLNYRLGVFGFLAHPQLTAESPNGASGNYGLLDQIEALNWVQRNIAAFGGDPDNVTIFGESAGALSAMYLLASPLAEGLFHKAITQSPYMVPTPELQRQAFGMASGEEIGLEVARKVGAADIAALRAIDADTLNALPPQGGPIPQATVDGWFLRDQLVTVFDAGNQADVPVIAGFNSDEIRSLPNLAPPVPASAAVYEQTVRAGYGDLAARFLELYPAADLEGSIFAARRDAIYGWSAERLAVKQAERGASSYLYYFDHSYPASDALGLGAFHAAEVPYVFGAAGTNAPLPANWPRPPVGPAEQALSSAMIAYWTSFAARGVPMAPGEDAWRPYAENKAFMAFRARAEASDNLLAGHYALAEEIKCRRWTAHQSWIPIIGRAAVTLPAEACGAAGDR